jgi:DNA-3-methyladenine glycosylase II
MDDLSDEEAVAALTAVTGVGLWSAEMFLIHQLRRRDVLPAGDIGVRRAIARAWTLDQAPTIDEVRQRGQTWAPYRSYATALLWRTLKGRSPNMTDTPTDDYNGATRVEYLLGAPLRTPSAMAANA